MVEPKRALTDEQMDRIISILLRTGVLISALVVLAGGIFYLIRYGTALPEYGLFRGEPADLRSVSGIVKDVLSFDSRVVIQFGLLLLVATPVARVAFSILAFALQRDRTYVVVTLIVLGVLLYSLTGGGL
jgi:uncharacterized membrane protein